MLHFPAEIVISLKIIFFRKRSLDHMTLNLNFNSAKCVSLSGAEKPKVTMDCYSLLAYLNFKHQIAFLQQNLVGFKKLLITFYEYYLE